ncbi:MAG TPA: hypothetical protein VGR20_16745 [Acidimicrobiia bacterium]|nr:hypothetical protein [Acidimicrobiia bacterium]
MDLISGTPRTTGDDVDVDDSDGAAGQDRWARHLDNRRRNRRRVAAGLAAAGVIAIVVGLSWHPGQHSAGTAKPQPVTVNDGSVTDNTAKPPSTAPGGVGLDPQKTGLPAVPAPGGRVRTGTKEQGCFANMREYLDAWDKTGQEPDPCFLSQDSADQPQPDDVVRSYNGEKF